MIAEVTSNGIFSMVPMYQAPARVSEGNLGNYYVHGEGSFVMECQHGGGVSGALHDDIWKWYHEYILCYEYESIVGFTGNCESMKCYIKQYDHIDKTWCKWREWDDVWETF